MCVLVQLTSTAPAWDPRDAAIRIPSTLTHPQMLLLTRQILAELGTPQPPESTMEARCYCGEPVTMQQMPAVRYLVPRQRIHKTEVRRGA
jgi:hypothetical protein